jgi:hypothetical protein
MRGEFTADSARALALAGALGLAWTARDWTQLSALRLPDTDDAMRLVQIRDWLAGQGWADLAQHRLAGGLSMHWTRLADLGPAALIVALAPVLGRHGAEVAAVIGWPILLFAAAILLVQRMARRAEAPAGVAAVLAALAYPATTVFAPGRIDHHGLQIVLLLGAALALLAPATLARGLAIGTGAVFSLVIGLETAPILAVVGAIAAAAWALGADGARGRLFGIGAGGIVALLLARATFAGRGWDVALCDGFTAPAWHAAIGAAGLGIALASLPTRFDTRTRLVAAAVGAGLLFTLVASVAPACFAPYGQVDPLLRRVWLAEVGEAQSIASAPLGTAIAYLGLALAALAMALWRLRPMPSRPVVVLVILQGATLALACVQLRGAYAAALIGVPALAAAVAAARRRGAGRLVLAWLSSAGIVYPLAAQAAPADAPAATCDLPPELLHLAPGLVAAPIDLGPRILLETRHSVLAAPYHRNNAGNRAAHALFAADPAAAGRAASALRVRYLLLCSAGRPAPAGARAVPASGGGRLFRFGQPTMPREYPAS